MKAPASTGGLYTQSSMHDNDTGSSSSSNSNGSSRNGSPTTSPKSTMALPLSSSRSESMAYPKNTASSFLRKAQWYARQNQRAVAATAAFFIFLLVISSDMLHDSTQSGGSSLRGSWGMGSSVSIPIGGAINRGYFFTKDAIKGHGKYAFAALTDLDQLSLMNPGDEKPKYKSVVVPGTITYDEVNDKYTLDVQTTRVIVTKHNEAGRGGEFSELTIFDDRLLTFDDRTGDVFEILNSPDGKESYVAPRLVITEGDGNTDKGMKWEWATTKGNGRYLYMGSMGKEYTHSDGTIANTNNLWISVYDRHTGKLSRVDWKRQFDFVRHVLGADSPGYLIHEAILWSEHLQKWVFAPRRISNMKYNDVEDEHRGSNKIVLIDDAFTMAQVVTVNMSSQDGLHGFSSLAFVPGTHDEHALALRSVEEDCTGDDLKTCKQRSYFVVFNVLTGKVLMDEIKINEDMKFEGVEFVDIFTVPPPTALSASG